MKYIICKASRGFTGRAYEGPTCRLAGSKPGKIYTDRDEAINDAVRMSQINPVGFLVYNLDTGELT